jgi:hypothetical protein
LTGVSHQCPHCFENPAHADAYVVSVVISAPNERQSLGRFAVVCPLAKLNNPASAVLQAPHRRRILEILLKKFSRLAP